MTIDKYGAQKNQDEGTKDLATKVHDQKFNDKKFEDTENTEFV